MLYRYVDILTGDRMIVSISISVRLATGFGGFMPSHSLAPVMIPQIWVVTTLRRHSLCRIQAIIVRVSENYSDCFMKFRFGMKIIQRKSYII